VHRGLLLGTGPLVDPGFVGRLFIPLHNLTSQPYTLLGGEGLIWVEFTKISPHPHWIDNIKNNNGYKHFPPTNRYLPPQQYLDKAKLNSPARSSIPLEIEEAVRVSNDAKVIATQAEQRIEEEVHKVDEKVHTIQRNISLGGIVAAIAVLIPVYGLVQDATQYVRESSNRDINLEKAIEEHKIVISDLMEKVAKLEIETRRLATKDSSKPPHVPK
jgi:hypothetical protein